MATRPILDGVVAQFDDASGLGTVRTGTGEEYPFHCTAIADGTRTIGKGRAVVFTVVPARAGRWEASVVRPRP